MVRVLEVVKSSKNRVLISFLTWSGMAINVKSLKIGQNNGLETCVVFHGYKQKEICRPFWLAVVYSCFRPTSISGDWC